MKNANYSKTEQYEIHFQFGIEYNNHQQYHNSILSYEKARLLKNSSELLRYIAQCYAKLDQTDLELNLMNEAYLLDKTNPDVLREFAATLKINKYYLKALKILEEFIELKPFTDNEYMIKAEALYKLGKVKEAKLAFENALLINDCPSCIKANSEIWKALIKGN